MNTVWTSLPFWQSPSVYNGGDMPVSFHITSFRPSQQTSLFQLQILHLPKTRIHDKSSNTIRFQTIKNVRQNFPSCPSPSAGERIPGSTAEARWWLVPSPPPLSPPETPPEGYAGQPEIAGVESKTAGYSSLCLGVFPLVCSGRWRICRDERLWRPL